MSEASGWSLEQVAAAAPNGRQIMQVHASGDIGEFLVAGLWDRGELFVGTAVGAATEPGTYRGGGLAFETARTTLVARRGARR
ncbi:hypothetical protein [Nocardia sp. NPDC046763]|uniref:hypothetical protein n=1 Tax=Nocardia sp. NPDC046763 TaxID=3155256 RepID=UPI0033C47486